MSRPMLQSATLLFLLAAVAAWKIPGQQHDLPAAPLDGKPGPLRKALSLLRAGNTGEARKEL